MTKMRPPGQSFRSRRIWASFTTAAAKVRAAVSAAAGNGRGCSTEALDGHLMMTTAGVSSAWTSSIRIESAPLI
jgi:hypothetical protein